MYLVKDAKGISYSSQGCVCNLALYFYYEGGGIRNLRQAERNVQSQCLASVAIPHKLLCVQFKDILSLTQEEHEPPTTGVPLPNH